jgi:hypothetical protein
MKKLFEILLCFALSLIAASVYANPNSQFHRTHCIDDRGNLIEGSSSVYDAVSESSIIDMSASEVAGSASISGTIYQSDGVTPITGKSIVVYAYSASLPCSLVFLPSSRVSVNTTNGTYSMTGLLAGTYYLTTVTSENYVNEWWASPKSVRDCAGVQTVAVTEGQNVSDKNFQLDPGATISGTVYESDGVTPMTGKNISIRVYTGSPCGSISYVGDASIDKTNGTYKIMGLPSGSYYLKSSSSYTLFLVNIWENILDEWWASPKSARDCEGAQSVAVTEGHDVSGKNFQLDPGATISGTVYESDGVTPITGKSITIRVYSGSSCGSESQVGYASVDNTSGRYTIDRLPSGNYYLKTDSSEYLDEWWASPKSVRDCDGAQSVVATEGQTVSGKNFQLDTRAMISGTVYESDGVTPITGKSVRVTAYTGSPCGNTSQVGYAYIDQESGAYTIKGLPSGTYYLQTDSSEYLDEWWTSPKSVRDCAGAQSVVLSEGQAVSGKNFQLEPGATISGVVYESDGVTPITGKSIYVYVYTGSPCGSKSQVGSASVDETSGVYAIKGLPSGTYYLYTSTSENYLAEWWASPKSVRDCAGAQSVVVTEGQDVSGKNFQLDPGATISGTVHESDGVTPIIGKSIYVYVYAGSPCGSKSQVGSASVDETSGVYTIKGLPAGTYYLQTSTKFFFSLSSENYLDEWWATPKSVRDCAGAQSVAVTEGHDVSGKNFQLDPGATISGTVYESDGVTPITGKSIYVNVYAGSPCGSKSQVGYAQIDKNSGGYMIDRLPSGTYYLQSSSSDNYIREWWASPKSLRDCAGAQSIVATEGQVITGKNFQLELGTTISGTVYQSDGVTQISGFFVRIDVYTGTPCGGYTFIGSSNGSLSGAYTIPALPLGTYYLRSFSLVNSYANEWWASPKSVVDCTGAQPIVISDLQAITGKNFQLEQSAGIVITAGAGTGGKITPSGSVPVTHGSGKVFTITPDAGYSVSTVTVDGASVSPAIPAAGGTYTFTNVTTSHTIYASFMQKTASASQIMGAWANGVWVWNASTKQWTMMASTSNASMIAAGKIDNDAIEDLVGVWLSGLYVRKSSDGQWLKLSTSRPTWITTGDLNNDGKDDVIGSWANDGVYYRNSATGIWTKLSTAAKQLATGNIGGVRDDLAGVWNDGLWVRYSADASWKKIDAAIPIWIAVGDLSGDKQADIVGSYSSGTWYRNSATKAWSKITTPAEQIATGDIDGDGRDDLIGVWGNSLWVRYGATNVWQQVSTSKPKWITTGRMLEAVQAAGSLDDPVEWGEDILDLSNEFPEDKCIVIESDVVDLMLR